jgi:phosphoenolpyruvate-protein kinase (PTS system EI component)
VLVIADDDTLVLDTTGSVASVWLTPSESVIADAQRRQASGVSGAPRRSEVAAPLAHLGVEVHVNVGSIHERLPASAEGIGLLRAELVLSAHSRAPSEAEPVVALRSIAGSIGSATYSRW